MNNYSPSRESVHRSTKSWNAARQLSSIGILVLLGITNAAGAISVTSTLLQGNVGQPYNSTLTGSGGASPYTFLISSGSLPLGLTLSPTGSLTGTPQGAGRYVISVQATDSLSASGLTNLTLNVGGAAGLTFGSTNLPAGRIGTAYDSTLSAQGGTSPYAYDLLLGGGSLPPGLTFSSIGRISGTPTLAGNFPIVARVTDAAGNAYQSALTLRIDASSLQFSSTSLPQVSTNVPFSQAISAIGGTGPYTYAVQSGTLPTGVTLTDGFLAGTITTAGTYNFSLRTTDSAAATATSNFSLVAVAGSPRLIVSSLPAGRVGQSYTGTLLAQGGTPPYTYALQSGTLPAGLSLGAAGTISGTPTVGGVFPVVLQITDAPGATAQTAASINVNSGAFSFTSAVPADGFTSQAYSFVPATTGGTSPITYSLLSGTLPAGITLSSTGALTGSPTAAGTYSFVLRGTDAGGATAQSPYTIRIQSAAFGFGQSGLANAQVGQIYSSTLSSVNGISPFSYSIVSGTLPPGLALSPNGNISGTPTSSGLFYVTFASIDSNQATSRATLPLFVASNGLSVNTLTLPSARPSTAFTATLQATGGVAPYTFTLDSGTLPTGLTLASGGLLSGTPTQTTSAPFTVRVTDSTGASSLVTYNLNLNSNAISLTSGAPATARLGFPYTTTFAGSGTAYTLDSGALPPGLSLSSTGILSGTPTAAGTYVFNLRAADASAQSAIFTQVVTVSASSLGFAPGQLPNIVSGTAYTAAFTGTGGTAPYTFSLVTGTLPSGITLAASGALSGSTTAMGSYPVTVRITDSTGASATTSATLTVGSGGGSGGGLTISTSTLNAGSTGSAYTATLAATGGTSPYTFTLASGSTLPAGLNLSSAGVLSGTPTANATGTFVVQVTDSTGATATRTLSFTSSTSGLNISTTTVPTGLINSSYAFTLAATGGSAPYTFTLFSGSLPPGLTFSTSGAISGTPTTAGSYPVVFQVTDATGRQSQKSLTISVSSSGLAFTNVSLPSSFVGQNFRSGLQAAGGTGPYTFSIVNGTLPAGLTLDASSGTISGIPTAAGTSNLTFRVTDSSGATSVNNLTLTTVQSSVQFGFTTIPAAMVGQSFNFTPTGSGTGQYTFVVLGGLPPGISVTPTGALTGTPTREGTYYVLLRAYDSAGNFVDSSFPIVVTATGFRFSTTTVPNGEANLAYNQSLVTTGGTGTVTYAVQSGNLPAGLTLSTAGVLSGTPTVPGAYNVTVRATDASGATASQLLSIIVSAAGLRITSNSLIPGTLNTAYSQALAVSGGTAPYTYTVTTGTLPVGLILSPAGTIAGTPTAAGTSTFTVRATDSTGLSTTSDFLIGIGAVGAARITAVVDAANYAVNGVVPGEIVVIYGTDLGPATLQSYTVTNNTVATTLAGTRVLFDGIPAPVAYASSTQVSVVVPFNLTSTTSTRIVVETNGMPSATILVPVLRSRPTIFTANSTGTGAGAVLNQDLTVNSALNAADRASIVSIYATGLGQTIPASVNGQIVSTPANLAATVTATVNGVAATVLYAGNAPGLIPGIAQINVLLPAGVVTGANAIQLTGNGVSSVGNVTVFVK